MPALEHKLKNNAVYYDGNCLVCSREINHIENSGCDLNFENIHDSTTIDLTEKQRLLKRLHVKTPDGAVLIGFEANVYLWKKYLRPNSPMKWLVATLELPLINTIAAQAYDFWAVRRYNELYLKKASGS